MYNYMKLYDLVRYSNSTNGDGIVVIVAFDKGGKFQKVLVMAIGKMKNGHDGVRKDFIQAKNNNAWFYEKELVKIDKEEI